jgi:uncharacterized repeat protein (TIGR01451 family)
LGLLSGVIKAVFLRAFMRFAIFALCCLFTALPALATPFTTTVPGTAITIPTTYPQAGGIVIVLEGVNGNVYYQFFNPSGLYSGTPAASPFNINVSPPPVLNCGVVTTCTAYLGGAIARMSVRFSANDGDAQTGEFDFNNLTLRINGFAVGGTNNMSTVVTQRTNVTTSIATSGTSIIAGGTSIGFGNQTATTQVDNGWFQTTDAPFLATVLTTGSVTPTVADTDPGDNAWNFKLGPDASATTVPLNVAPGITIDKVASTTTYSSVGQTINYTYTIVNIGSVYLDSVAVSDNKIPGVVCPAGRLDAPTLALPTPTKVCTATYTVTQADIDAGVITNVATVTAVPQAGSLGSANDTVTVTGPASAPSMTMTKSAAPSPFGAVGSTVTYSFAIKNTGNVTFSSVAVSDPLLPTLSCTTAPIAPGVTITATCTNNTKLVTQAMVDAGSVTNTASATAKAPNGAAVAPLLASTIITNGPAQTPSIALVKSAGTIADTNGSGRQDAGDKITYAFKVTNTGNVTLTNVKVTDPLVAVVGGPIATLAPGAINTTTFTATYTLTQTDVDAGVVSNQAKVVATAPAGVADAITDLSDPASNTGGASTLTNVTKLPSLFIDKTTTATSFDKTTDTLSYSYSIKNTGNVTLNNVVLADDKIVLPNTISCPASPINLIPNATIICSATYQVKQADIDAGGVTNQATVTSGATTATDQVFVPSIKSPSATTDKTARPFSPAQYVVGFTVTYDYVITNTGNTTLTGSISVADSRIAPANLTCGAGPIAPGGTLACVGTYVVTSNDVEIGSVTNLATSTIGGTSAPQVSATIPVGASPALSIAKTTTSTSFAAVGDVIPYVYKVTNSGTASFASVITVVDDKIPGPITCFTPSGGDPDLKPADPILGTPAEFVTCSANYTVTQADLDRGYVTNQATANTVYQTTTPVASPVDTITVNATLNPALLVTKSVTPADLPVTTVGQVLHYTIAVKNSGNQTMSNILVTDPLIPSLSCSIATLAPTVTNSSCTGTYTVTQADFDLGKIVNTATADGLSPQGTPISDDGLNTVTITQVSSLTIAKVQSSYVDADGSGTRSLNDVLTYTVTATNAGNVTQTNVVVADTLLSTSPKTCASVAPAGTCVLTGTYTVTQADVDNGKIDNTGSVTSTLITAPVKSIVSTVIPQTTGIALIKTAGTVADTNLSGRQDAGDAITYAFEVTNTGNVTLTNVKVTDPLVAVSGGPLASLAPGAANADTGTFTATYTLTQADIDFGSVSNQADASGKPPTGAPIKDKSDPTSNAGNAFTVTTLTKVSSLGITKVLTPPVGVIKPGDVLTYTVTATNTGTVTQASVVVSDPLLGAASPKTCASVAPAGTCVLTGTYTVKQADVDAGKIDNTGSVKSTLITTAVTKAVSTPIPQVPSVALVKSAGTIADTNLSGRQDAGDKITYAFKVTNTGNVTLTNLKVADPLVAVVGGPLANLAPGAINTATFTATYTLAQADVDAGVVSNQATALATAPSGVVDAVTDLSDPASNAGSASTLTTITKLPELFVDKTSTTLSFDDLTDTLSYSYLVKNTGNVTLANVTLADDKIVLPNTLSCPVGPIALAPNATFNCAATYQVNQADIDAGGVTNTATASSGATAATDQVFVPSVRRPSAIMTKVARPILPAQFVVGAVVTYDYVITNTGNTTLTGVASVLDSHILPANLTCNAVPVAGLAPPTPGPAGAVACLGTYVVTSNDVEIGSVTNLATGKVGTTTAPQVSETVPLDAIPALSIAKTSTTPSFAALGDIVHYDYLITNSGTASFASIITVLDDKIVGPITCFTPTVGDPDLKPDNPLTVAIDPETASCFANYFVTQADLDRGYVTNQATANTIYKITTPVVSPPDSVTVNAGKAPALEVTKSVRPTDLPVTAVGQLLHYTIAVKNVGNQTLSNIGVSDPLIPTLSCTIVTLAPTVTNSSCTGIYTVTQADFDLGRIDNTATASGVSPQGAPISDTGSNTVTITQNSTLGISKLLSSYVDVDSSGTRSLDDILTYTITVTNTGNVTQNAVVVSDPLLSTSPMTCASVAPAGTCVLTGTYQIMQFDVDAGKIDNTGSVTSTRITSPVKSAISTTIPQFSAVVLIKKAGVLNDANGNGRPDAGETLTQIFEVTNKGNVTLSNLVVTDIKPGVTITGSPIATLAPAELNDTVQASYTLTQADIDAGSVSNTADVSGNPPTGPPVTDKSDPVSLTGFAPTLTSLAKVSSLSITKALTPPVGPIKLNDVLTYTITATNTGNITQTAVVVSDPLLGAASPKTCASVAPAGTCVLTGTYTVTQVNVDAGKIDNEGSVKSTLITTAVKSAISTPVPQNASVALIKKAGVLIDTNLNGRPDVGEKLSYDFVVKNTGTVTLTNLIVTDAKPSVTITGSPIATLGVGLSSSVVKGSYTLTQTDIDAGTVSNSADVAANPPTGPPVTDKSDPVSETAYGDTLTSLTQVSSLAAAKVLTPPVGPIKLNDVLTYTITATNTGNITQTAVVVSDPLLGAASPLTCASVAPAGTCVLTGTYTVTQANVDAGKIDNEGSVKSTLITTAVKSAISTSIPQSPAVALIKKAGVLVDTNGNSRPDVGEKLSYDFVVKNTGNVTLTNLVVTDLKPGVTVTNSPIATLGVGLSDTTVKGSYTLTQADIDAGTTSNTASVSGDTPVNAPPLLPDDSDPLSETGSAPTLTALTKVSSLSLSKLQTTYVDADTSGTRSLGDILTYTVTATNTGNITQTAVVVSDPLLGAASPLTCASVAPAGTCVLTGTYTVTQANVDAGKIDNEGSVKSTLITTAVKSAISTSIPQSPAVALIKKAGVLVDTNGNSRPDVGEKLSYDFVVSNKGTVTLTNLVVTDANPLVTLTGSPIATLGVGLSDTTVKGSYTLTQADIDAGTTSNTASVSGDTPVNAPPLLPDDSDPLSETGSAPTLTTLTKVSSLSLDKLQTTYVDADTSGTRSLGDVLTYTVTVTNTGNITQSAVVVSDPLLGAASPKTCASVAPAGTCVLTGTYTITQLDVNAGKIGNTGSVTSTLITTAVKSTISTSIPQNPAVALIKKAGVLDDFNGNNNGRPDVGEKLIYDFVVKNTGNVTLTNLIVTDTNPLVTITGSPIGTLEPGISDATVKASYTLTQIDIDAGTTSNTASVSGDTPVGAPPLLADASDPVSETGSAPTLTALTKVSSLIIAKALTPQVGPVKLNDVLTYTVTATNTGNITQNAVIVSDPLLGAASPKACASVAPAGMCVLTGTYTVTQANVDAGKIDNTGTVTSTLINDPLNPVAVTISTAVPQGPAVELIKKVGTIADTNNSTRQDAGDTVTYKFTVTNTGNVTLHDLIVTDPKISVTVTGTPIASLDIGVSDETSYSATYVLTLDDMNAGLTLNQASVSAFPPTGPSFSDSSAPTAGLGALETTTPVNQLPSIALIKTITSVNDDNNNGRTDAGDSISYAFKVTNTGNVTLTDVLVTDPLVTVTGGPIVMAPGDINTGEFKAKYTITLADADFGSVSNTAEVTGQPPFGARVKDSSDPAVETSTAPTIQPIDHLPSIAMIKGQGVLTDTNNNGIANVGEKLTFPFTIKNTGNVTLKNITAAESLSGASVIGGSISSLAPGDVDSTTLKAVYTLKQSDVDADAGGISNQATVTGTPPTILGNPAPAKVSDVSDDNSYAEAEKTFTPIVQVPKLSLTKAVTANADEDQSGYVTVNDTLTYTVTATNTGNTTLNNITVGDTLIAPNSHLCAALAPTEICTLVGTYQVSAADISAHEILNVGTVVSDEINLAVSANARTAAFAPFDAARFTKVALKAQVARGERVTYVIEARDLPLNPARVVDTIPPGFDYVAGSARSNGVSVTPVIAGRVLTFDGLIPDADSNLKLEITLVATAAVEGGQQVNTAQLVAPSTGRVLATARATVTIKIEAVFDCGDIIGKVFDDANRNGYQDEGERGLAGVRVATVKGLLVTTDKFGRFHVACADIPDGDIGSNFYMKLDTRTLPTGYRVTTENPRDVRLTRGKVTKLNFGASITRVIKIDLSGRAYEPKTTDLLQKWQDQIDTIIEALAQQPSTLSLTYDAKGESSVLATKRLAAFEKLISARWDEQDGRYKLPIESRIIGVKGNSNDQQ